MSRVQAEQMALAHSESGLHCAESVASTITQLFCPDQTETVCRMATGFGGGLAGSRQEACGALTGGVIAIGLLCGRSTPKQGREAAYQISAAYRERFMARFGATICQTLRDSFSTDSTRTACRSLTAEAAGLLYDILVQHGYSVIAEMRRVGACEAWLLENKEAIAQRCSQLEAEGGSSAERLYGVQCTEGN